MCNTPFSTFEQARLSTRAERLIARHGLQEFDVPAPLFSVLLAAQAMLGSAKTVLESGQHPAVLKDGVCSPGGSTIEGVEVLEAYSFRSALAEAVKACTERNRELGS